MKLRVVKPFRMKAVPGVEIQTGSELEVTSEVGLEWIKSGHAIQFAETEKTEKAVMPEPEKRTAKKSTK